MMKMSALEEETDAAPRVSTTEGIWVWTPGSREAWGQEKRPVSGRKVGRSPHYKYSHPDFGTQRANKDTT